MSASNNKETEIQKLLHVLQVDSDTSFSFLKNLSKEELQKLRLQVIEVSQFTQTDIWKRLTGVSKYFPNYMNAKISETVMGPLIVANMSYYMPIKDAIAIMKHLSMPFLVSVAEYMTPEKSKNLTNQIPIDILKKITTELVNRKKFMTAAGFVDVLELSRLIELSKVITREDDLISISSFVENKKYIAQIIEGFTDERLSKIITVAYNFGKQDEILTVFSHQSNKEVQRIMRIVSVLPVQLKTQILQDFETRVQKL
ncbi:MAG: hypothetical protein U0T07_04980 [Chitinophagales bacterium]